MIEIEKYITPTAAILKKILSKGSLLSSEKILDEYWDTADFALAQENKWLNLRNKTWKLKAPIIEYGTDGWMLDKFLEIEDEYEIKNFIKLPQNNKLLINNLKDNKYSPYITLSFDRSKYQLDQNISLIIDEVGNEKFIKLICSGLSSEDTTILLYNYLLQNNISILSGYNKTISFIKNNNKDLFNKLITANIIPKKAA